MNSTESDFATSRADARYPALWDAMAAFYCPPAGRSGLDLLDRGPWRRHGVYVNRTVESFKVSQIGTAIEFDGTDDYVSIANFGDLLDGKLLTVSVWINPLLAGTTYPRIVDRVYNGQFALYLNEAYNSIGGAIVGTGASVDTTISSTDSVPWGTWTHVAITYDGDVLTGWINGRPDSTNNTASGVLASSSSEIRIGQRADGTDRTYEGLIGPLGIWGRVLTASEIRRLYTNHSAPIEPVWELTAAGLLVPAAVLAVPPMRLGAPTGPNSAPRDDQAAAYRGKHLLDARGLYRVFESAEYRFFRSNSAPPAEGDTPFATNATLPHQPAATFGDGTWYLSVSLYNGLHDSGFLPIGPRGETYLRLDVDGGAAADAPPDGPLAWWVAPAAAGAIRVWAIYYQEGARRADQWSIAYAGDGTTPEADNPDVNVDMAGGGLEILDYELPAVAHGTTVEVRLQTRRNDGTDETPDWVYSEASTVKLAVGDTQGPLAAPAATGWPGKVTEN